VSHYARLVTVDYRLPNENDDLEESAGGNSKRKPDVPTIGTVALIYFGGLFGGLFIALYGVSLDYKRRLLSTSCIGVGCLCSAIATGFLMWWVTL
jgi:hypothetical protein